MRMGYRVGGRGTPLVLITGRSATMADWDPRLLSQLAIGHRLVVFDNRGAGTTDNPSRKRMTIGQLAADTLGLMTRLRIERADVLGWSMGGMIAQQVTIDAPRRVIRLVLCATTPGGVHARLPSERVQRVLDNPDLATVTLLKLSSPPSQAGLQGAVAYEYAVATQPDLVPDSFTINRATRANQERATAQWKSANGGDYYQLPYIQQRTLVLWGRLDDVEPPYNDRLIVSRLPHAQGRSFPDAGHDFLFQDPVAVGQVIHRFLR
jgi:pimeloyl-ACP methyl ester carboxylesterase